MSINLNSSACNFDDPYWDNIISDQLTADQSKVIISDENTIEMNVHVSPPNSMPPVVGYNTPSPEEDVVEECLKCFDCPITLQPFTDPVVDDCGHTFEREAIMEIYNRAIAKGIPFICPLDPTKILDVTRFVKNYSLAVAQEKVTRLTDEYTALKTTDVGKLTEEYIALKTTDVGKLTEEYTALKTTAVQTIEELMQKHKEEMQKHKADIQKHKAERQEYKAERQDYKAEIKKMIGDHEQFLKDFRPLARETVENLNRSANVLQQCSVLESKNSALEKEVKNLQDMGIADRLVTYVYPRYNDTVSKRNLTPEEQKVLNQSTTITAKEINAEERKLRDLKVKIEEKYWPTTEKK
ncbi:hypothetical protein [Candidatus Protochlamydia sp. W-9]|uniref:hypothetical protein n=1 Tax=Candidatus Protochlamydia sp. W-9 TaxID=1785087 RepID=UPI00096A8D0B|nr:hypothetical protein [Candidatus Protochlamydia sp. W-9]